MQSFIMPRLIMNTESHSAVTRTDRSNRFHVQLEIGEIGCCVADSQKVIQDTMDDLVARIKMNWRNGIAAGGQEVWERADYGYHLPGIKRDMKLDEFCKYQNQALDGTLKIPRRTKKNRTQVESMKRWVKAVKKDFTWHGKVYHPVTTGKTLDYSGLMIDSLTADKVKIRAKTGKYPAKVTCRMTVAPSRGDTVIKRALLLLPPGSEVWRETTQWMQDVTKNTTVFMRHDAKEKLTLAKMAAIYNRYRNQYRQVSNILSTATRFL